MKTKAKVHDAARGVWECDIRRKRGSDAFEIIDVRSMRVVEVWPEYRRNGTTTERVTARVRGSNRMTEPTKDVEAAIRSAMRMRSAELRDEADRWLSDSASDNDCLPEGS